MAALARRLMVRISSTVSSIVSPTRVLMGTDLDGNQYFEAAKRDPHTKAGEDTSSMKQQVRRSVVMKSKITTDDYSEDHLPVEWTAWLNGRRAEPPTLEELQASEGRRQILQMNVDAINERDEKERQAYSQQNLPGTRQPAIAQSVSHGATGEADSFTPDSWAPGK